MNTLCVIFLVNNREQGKSNCLSIDLIQWTTYEGKPVLFGIVYSDENLSHLITLHSCLPQMGYWAIPEHHLQYQLLYLTVLCGNMLPINSADWAPKLLQRWRLLATPCGQKPCFREDDKKYTESDCTETSHEVYAPDTILFTRLILLGGHKKYHSQNSCSADRVQIFYTRLDKNNKYAVSRGHYTWV